ncbi:hypothetical protein LP417_11010 [Polaromonas sp. P1-6]|nr:hypothetical protein LP417_11010 [Polaromonas sp. P1-6]
MFDPAWFGIDLGQLLLGLGHDVALFVKHNTARAGGALVEGEQISHGLQSAGVGAVMG